MLGLLVLAILARASGAQQAPDAALVAALDDLAGDLRARLSAAAAPERLALLEELAALEVELRELLASSPDEAVCLALYKALAARAELDEREPLEARLARFDEAIELADRSALAEPRARARLLKAECLTLHGRYGAARESLRASLEQVPDQVGTRAFTCFSLAEVEARLGAYASALEELGRAEAACLPGEPWDALRARMAGTRGQVYLDLGLVDRAAECFTLEARALERASAELDSSGASGSSGPSWKGRVAAELHAMHLALAQRRWGRAAELAERALGRLGDDRPIWSAVVRAVQAEALGRMADRDPALAPAARAAFDEALAGELPERDRLVAEVRRARLETLTGEHARSRALLAEARGRLERLRGGDSASGTLPEEALLATEEARLALAEGGSRAELERRLVTLEHAFGERLALWSETPLVPGGLGFLQQPSRRSWLWALTRLALAVDGPEVGAERALGLWMSAQAQGVLVRGLALEAGTPRAARELLCRAERGLAVYLCAPEGSFLALLDDTGVAIVELAPEAALLELVEVDDRRALSSALVPPELEQRLLRWTDLAVVGFELLGRVGFEALTTTSGEALGAGWALSYLPSLPLGLWLADPLWRDRAGAERAGCVLLAAPLLGPLARERWSELAPLAIPPERLEELRRACGEPAVLLQGAEATPERLRKLGARARVLTVLAHGVRAEEREQPALLLLAPDPEHEGGWIGADEILAMEAPELVVLGACAGGLGPLRRGDAESGSLVGAFLSAGARCVLASEQDLPLGPTVELCARFQRELESGLPPAEALRRARNALAAQLGAPALQGIATLRAIGWAYEPVADGAERLARPAPAPETRRASGLLAGALGCMLLALGALGRARKLRARAG